MSVQIDKQEITSDIFTAFKNIYPEFKNVYLDSVLPEQDQEKILKFAVEEEEQFKDETRKYFFSRMMHTKFEKSFNSLQKILYRSPTKEEKKWLKANNVAKDTLIYIKQPRVVHANIELKQRALSFVEAVWKIVCINLSERNYLTIMQFAG